MSTEMINSKNLKDYKDLLAKEHMEGIRQGYFSGIGARFSDEVAGVILFCITESRTADLYYIYVDPVYRRLGIGTELIDATSCSYFTFTYEATGDRVTLEPFFTALDIETERVDYPYSEISMTKIKEGLTKQNVIKAKRSGSFINELESKEKDIISKWVVEGFGENPVAYYADRPKSIFYLKDSSVYAAILLSELYDDTLSLDYVYSKNASPLSFAGMMKRILEKALEDYGGEAYVRMLPKTEDGMDLYTSLFGETERAVPIVFSA